MANPEGGGVNRTRGSIDDGNAVVNSGSAANLQDPDPASDTEQHGGVDISGQKLGGKKKACFQITQVLPVSKAANNDGNMDDPDSNDEQDESHADDFSSSERIDSFNMSKCSIPDLDHSLDDSSFDPVVAPSSMPAPSGSAEEQTNNVTSNATQANGNGPHRFKVVRVASEPIRKGRWICRDFPSESSNVKTTNQTTPDSLRNQDPSKETLHSGNSSAASSVHYVHGQDNNSDNPLTVVDEGGKPSDLGRKTSSTSTKDSENRINPKAIQEDQKDDKLRLVEQLKDELDLQEHTSESTEGDEGTSPAGGAIDNKIEQAM
ncbi:uncharacterized protein, partial [Diadema antillarum]|uniref:uncharacterized protein n=1 Tax=Diadema antillarum TaxID=105358 RepID=UPI003A873BF9